MFMDWVIHIGQLCTVKQQHPHLAPHKVKFSFLTPQPLPCPTMAQVRVPAVAFYLQHPYSLNSKLESKPECPAFSVVISSYSAEYRGYSVRLLHVFVNFKEVHKCKDHHSLHCLAGPK